MILPDLLQILKANDAFVVHCSRSNRGGELEHKPLYPSDMRDTIRDLGIGNVRPVSCSVVWPAHRHTFGEIGIIVKPREVGDIIRLCTGDGGTQKDGTGLGEPLSDTAVRRTFAQSTGHNEWVLIGGDVVGIFLNFDLGLYVARLMDAPPGMAAEDAEKLGILPEPYPVQVTVADVAADFPELPLFGFLKGVLMEMDSAGNPVAPRHPY